ncbi:MAG: DNA topoisomerase IV subunit A [Planctomycetota bacterium]|nr:DNA topoisomerase IV subunit A [Planctomycetota bacterium]
MVKRAKGKGSDDGGEELFPTEQAAGSIDIQSLMRRNFLEYASYVVVDRAIPDLRDGFKPVQRRILTTLWNMHDGRFHKVANVIGDTMKLHPHGDASIGDALVVLANKGYFIETQGNFGNVITGHRAAAARYIECRLTPLARETLFFPELTDSQASYDGRRDEPVALPAKLPVVLLLGVEGIAVGMATRILPHNFNELLEAQIKLLRKESVVLYPDFPHGGLVDVSEYDDGRGKVKVRARIEALDDKTIVIREIPYGTTTESLIASLENAAQKGQVKIGGIQDYTTDKVEIHVELPRGVHSDETIPQLFAYTDCEVSISSALTVVNERHPADLTVSEALEFCTKRLKAQIKAELELELAKLEDKRHWLTLEQIFIEEKVWKRLEKAKTAAAVTKETWDGMQEHKKLFVRPMTDEDVERLLKIPIRRISAYDIERFRAQMDEIRALIKAAQAKLKNLTKTTIDYLEGLIDRYGANWPRRTEIGSFESVDRKAVARQNIKVTFDAETGFFGSQVRSGEQSFSMSEYDKVLAISDDGTYRVVSAVDKVLFPGKVLHIGLFDADAGEQFTVVYRTKDKIVYGKRVHILRFIKAKEYRLIKDRGGEVLLLLQEENPGDLHLSFVRAKRQRVHEATFDLNELRLTSASAKGIRLAPKPVSRVKRLS